MFPEEIYCPLIYIWGFDELLIILGLPVAEGGPPPLEKFDEVL